MTNTSPLLMTYIVETNPQNLTTPTALAHAMINATLESVPTCFTQLTHDWKKWLENGHRKILRHAKPTLYNKIVDTGIGQHHTINNINIYTIPPCTRETLPKPVQRAQVSGLKTLPNPPHQEAAPENSLHVIMNNQLTPTMSIAKATVAAAHATHITRTWAITHNHTELLNHINNRNIHPTWAPLPDNPIITIHDAGHTEVAPNTPTSATILT